MKADYLNTLRRRYQAPEDFDPLRTLLEKYRQYRATSVLDLATVSANLALDTMHDRVNVDPLALNAIRDTNPNFDPDRILRYSDEEWMGMVNSAKGKYFEYMVADRLNQGEAVGDLVLPAGYHAELASSMNQPGWDIRIIDDHGRTSEYLQLKATESLSYIHQALERYPDITILATDEVANHAYASNIILDSDIREADIERIVGRAMDVHGTGLVDHFWDAFHPVIPLLTIAVTQGYRVVIGKQHIRHAAEVAKGRAERALAASGVGALVKALGGGWWSIPAAILTGVYVTRRQKLDKLVQALRERNRRLGIVRNHLLRLSPQ